MTVRKLARHPVFGRILIANGLVVIAVGLTGTLVVRLWLGLPLWVLAVAVAVLGLAAVTAADYILIRTSLRPLLGISHIIEAIRRGADPNHVAADQMSDPDLSLVSTALMETVDRLEHEARRYSSRLLTSIEDERRRIGRELHDETSQTLAAALINLDLIEKGLGECSPEIRQRAANSKELIVHTLEQIKLLVYDLRPSMLDDLGLVPALRWYIQSHLSGRGLIIETDFERVTGRLGGETETALYRIAQESLANVVKHACASRVSLSLEVQPGYASLAVHDNGAGFDADEVLRDRGEHYGLGLLSIRERAELLGGTLNIRSGDGDGTHVYVVVPLEGGEYE